MSADAVSTPDVLLAEVTRGTGVESQHFGAVAVAFEDGSTWSAGDVESKVFARSAIKPLQALPLVESGCAQRLSLSDEELALCCASHDGTALHVATAERLLARGGLTAAQLGCGPHVPFDKRAAFELAQAGARPSRLHNNCSGKHAGFLLLAQSLGQDLATYLDPDGDSQRAVRRVVADFTGAAIEPSDLAIDGCGAPTMRLPLRALAEAFCRFVNPARLLPVRAAACQRLRSAIDNAPVHLAGEGRLGTLLVREVPGRVVPKNGAEGVYVVGGMGTRGAFGVAVKVRDGAERGYFPLVVAVLERLGLFRAAALPQSLTEFREVPLQNTNRVPVGCVRLALDLPSSW